MHIPVLFFNLSNWNMAEFSYCIKENVSLHATLLIDISSYQEGAQDLTAGQDDIAKRFNQTEIKIN